MSKYRMAAKVDANQKEIVKALRDIPGVSVETGHDDLLIGRDGKTYWVEIKESEKACLQPSQEKLLENWNGHYMIAWNIDMILEEIGVKPASKPPQQ